MLSVCQAAVMLHKAGPSAKAPITPENVVTASWAKSSVSWIEAHEIGSAVWPGLAQTSNSQDWRGLGQGRPLGPSGAIASVPCAFLAPAYILQADPLYHTQKDNAPRHNQREWS